MRNINCVQCYWRNIRFQLEVDRYIVLWSKIGGIRAKLAIAQMKTTNRSISTSINSFYLSRWAIRNKHFGVKYEGIRSYVR